MKTYFRLTRFEVIGVLVEDRFRPLDRLEAVSLDLSVLGMGVMTNGIEALILSSVPNTSYKA